MGDAIPEAALRTRRAAKHRMAKIKAYYDRYWGAADGAPPEHDPLIERKWRELARYVAPGNRVLDYGCGGGIFSKRFVEAGCQVVGMDIAEEPLELARSRVPHGKFMRVQPGEPLPAEGFDIIWASEVLEHVYDTQFLMGEFARVLKPGGQLLVTAPYHGFLKNLLIVFLRFERHFDPEGAHIRFFTRRSLCRLAEEAGLMPKEFVGLARVPYLWKSMFVVFIRR